MVQWGVVLDPIKITFHKNNIKKQKYGKHRRSRQEVFCKKGVLRNFANFTRKHLCQSLFFNKVAGLSKAWTRYSNAKLIKNISNLLVTLLRFCFRKQPKKLNFQRFLTSKRPFGGYFQCNACTYFQKICSWIRYSNDKLIKNISNFLVTLFRFCFGNFHIFKFSHSYKKPLRS